MSNERKHYGEVHRTFRAIGAYVNKHSDIHYAVRALTGDDTGTGKSGHPDYTIIMPPYGMFVEVKGADSNFNLSEISEAQRTWFYAFPTISYIWLFMGDGRINARDEAARPRKAYLVPWVGWLLVEDRLHNLGMAGIPYLPHSLEYRRLRLSANQLLGRYELQWASGYWRIPRDHFIWSAPTIGAGLLYDHYRNYYEESPYDANLAEQS